MSHYASSLCFLKIKPNLRSDFLNTMESYYSTIASDEYHQRMMKVLYDLMDCEMPYYPEWFIGSTSYDKSYVSEYTKDFVQGMDWNDDQIFVIETTAAKIWHQIRSIESTIDKLTDGYIIIRQCEDAHTYIESKNISIFPEKFTNVIKNVLKNEDIKLSSFDFTKDEYQHLSFVQASVREPNTVFGININGDDY